MGADEEGRESLDHPDHAKKVDIECAVEFGEGYIEDGHHVVHAAVEPVSVLLTAPKTVRYVGTTHAQLIRMSSSPSRTLLT